ncbi:ABC transporter ATP-binding protein [Embleya scabrispora]|uniref:ABC transporter ATP-binding protein n=1 Tax=Embleya scabrispora TaxID=159449 RepID=UPI001F249665|nr:ATP-binding cassette domain-containing protein [Embleya scabrispora]
MVDTPAWDIAPPVFELDGVDVWAHGPAGRTDMLVGVDWTVREGERWALLGHNGAGKSTILALAGALRFPGNGAVTVLGKRLGKVDVREVRAQVGAVNAALRVPEYLTVTDYVLTGASGTVQPLYGKYGPAEHARAAELIALLGLERLARREIAVCSQGERGRARIARALMPDPRLLLLDEPANALDLPSREELLEAIDSLTREYPRLTLVIVTHHLEELPTAVSHALLLRRGATVASGPVREVMTDANLSECFGIPLTVRAEDGRWAARLRRPGREVA